MDRIEVCGTFDPGSIPGGCTFSIKNKVEGWQSGQLHWFRKPEPLRVAWVRIPHLPPSFTNKNQQISSVVITWDKQPAPHTCSN